MVFLPSTWRLAALLAVAAGTVAAATACQAPGSITDADVPSWKATTLPSASGIVLEDAGKILNRDPIVKDAASVTAGNYRLTMACDGGGKAFFAVTSAGRQIADAGAACNGSLETVRIKVATSGPLSISTSSVDAPLIYAYQLVPAA
ncbi:hypothetical protein [Arthrobacter cavernae]|uniref:Lipoprotein n=1 Tax=Arthrobacter cavernae TaxID=2817681 RepID=A0A939HGM0_9MICC|nr:hypothetical protein [Arthrobacter cavernae]MBO1267622.1 hypothetical protein [Arthrobacter cavernae]